MRAVLGRQATGSIPGPEGRFLLGHLRSFSQDPLGFLTRLRDEHGPIASYRLAHRPYVLVSDPEAIEQVLVRDHRYLEKNAFMRQSLGQALGDGMLTAEGGQWLEARQLAQPAFRPKRIQSYGRAMVEETQAMVDAWEDGQIVPVADAMAELTLRIAARTLFDLEVGPRARAIGDGLDAIMARFRTENRLISMLPAHLPLPSNLTYLRGVRQVHGIIEELIEERAQAGTMGQDLLSELIRANRAQDGPLDDGRLRDELITLLVAGHETTALALSWTLGLLGQHPDIDEVLGKELTGQLDGGCPDPADLSGLDLLEAVVEEGMRLYPPAWAIGRQAVEPIEVLGHELAPGTQIFMSQWVVHRDPAWFKAPGSFRPRRWLGGLDKTLPRFAYFPFGGGPRTCIGNNFAMLEAQLILGTILSRYRLAPVDDELPEPDPSITLRLGSSLPMRVQARPV